VRKDERRRLDTRPKTDVHTNGFYDPAGKTIYMPLNTYQPVIPKSPPIYHAVLDNNLLAL